MTHISKGRLADDVLRQITDSFLFVLTDIKDKDSMAQFLDSFLSKTEKLMLAKRLALIYLLNERVEETRISEILKTTLANVSRMKLKLESKNMGYQQALAKIKKQKTLEELKDLALKLARYSIHAAGGRI
mgnify:CR=1 FL=1